MLRARLAIVVALVAPAFIVLSAGAGAQTAEKQAAPPAKKAEKAKGGGSLPTVVTVTNEAALLLAGVEISTTESEPRIVGSLPQGLQSGKSTKIRLRSPKGCEYSVVAVFEDGSEAPGGKVDLCKDPSLRFTAIELKRAPQPREPDPGN
jgi:hypothetical protein